MVIDINLDDGLLDGMAAMQKFCKIAVTEPDVSKVRKKTYVASGAYMPACVLPKPSVLPASGGPQLNISNPNTPARSQSLLHVVCTHSFPARPAVSTYFSVMKKSSLARENTCHDALALPFRGCCNLFLCRWFRRLRRPRTHPHRNHAQRGHCGCCCSALVCMYSSRFACVHAMPALGFRCRS